MPNDRYSEALKEAYASDYSDPLMVTLELIHPAFLDDDDEPTGIRVVLNNEDITAKLEDDAPLNGGEFVPFMAFAFEFQPPAEEKDGGIPSATLVIDNATSEIVAYLEQTVGSQESIIAILRFYLGSDLTTVQNMPPYRFFFTNIEASPLQVTGHLEYIDPRNKAFPAFLYTATEYVGLTR